MPRFAEAVGQAVVDIVPRVVMQSGGVGNADGGGGHGNVLESLLTLMLSERLDTGGLTAKTTPPSEDVQQLRDEMRAGLRASFADRSKT